VVVQLLLLYSVVVRVVLVQARRYKQLLLLHAVVVHPELDTKAQKRRQGIMVNDTKLIIAVMHYRVYNILKFPFSYSEPYNPCFFKWLW
jgi:hypothetical protein